METLVFDFPVAWRVGVPLAVVAVVAGAWVEYRRGVKPWRVAAKGLLRAVALAGLALLLARPAWVRREPPAAASRTVVLLVDRSESMSVEENDTSRYRQALDFLREDLLPALKSARLPVQAFLFAEDAEPADGARLNTTAPQGRRTNLGGAIDRAVRTAASPPLAVIALTDGIANEAADNARGLSALVQNRVPFIGLGFGSDTGTRTLSLRQVDAAQVVPTNTMFRVSAQLEMVSDEDLPPFDLVLMRDGKVTEKKTIQPGRGARLWIESFLVSEPGEGVHRYLVQFLPPAVPGLKCASTSGSASVVIAADKELRVLYVQGALTWDYKFVNLALRGDPSIKLTGLTRTSKQSVFRQNIETAGELRYGFPTTLEEIAPFRVVVLADLAPADLSASQQELLARYCGELGGGLLMIGGPSTFHASWVGTRLEGLLPVTFAAQPGLLGLDRPFHLRLTGEALQHPLFQVDPSRPASALWTQIPTFSRYGRVDAAKPGAQVWAEHPDDEGPRGKRILMASQRFGAGLSAVICLQNFWRWRLAKDSDPHHFDRFWRQLFRFLSEPSRQDVTIHLADQELRPGMDVQIALERKPKPSDLPADKYAFTARVENPDKKVILDQPVELPTSTPLDLRFRAETPGLYTIAVHGTQQTPVATRTLEIRDVNVEFQETRRNLETLRQWAALSDGLALPVEHCPDAAELLNTIQAKVEQVRHSKPLRRPAGLNAWILTLLLASLAAEWSLRKKWKLP